MIQQSTKETEQNKMKSQASVCSVVLASFLMAGTVLAGEMVPMPIAPPPPVTTVKKAHVQKVEKNTAPLNVFDLLSMMLSNLGIL